MEARRREPEARTVVPGHGPACRVGPGWWLAPCLLLASAATLVAHGGHHHGPRLPRETARRLGRVLAEEPTLAAAFHRGSFRRLGLGEQAEGFLLLPPWRAPRLVELAPAGDRLHPEAGAPALPTRLRVELTRARGEGQPAGLVEVSLGARLGPPPEGTSWPRELLLVAPPDVGGPAPAARARGLGWERLHAEGVFRLRVPPAWEGPVTLSWSRRLPAGGVGPYELGQQVPLPLSATPGPTAEVRLRVASDVPAVPVGLRASGEPGGPADPGEGGPPAPGEVEPGDGAAPVRRLRAAIRLDPPGAPCGFLLAPAAPRGLPPPRQVPRSDAGDLAGDAPSVLRVLSAGLDEELAADLATRSRGLHRTLGEWLGPRPAALLLHLAPAATQARGVTLGEVSALGLPPGPATTGPATTGPATTGPATTGPATTGPATRAALAHELAHPFVDGGSAGLRPDLLHEGLANLLALLVLEEAGDVEAHAHLRSSLSRALLGMTPGALASPSFSGADVGTVKGARAHRLMAELAAYALQAAALHEAAAACGRAAFLAALRAALEARCDTGLDVPGLLEALREVLPEEAYGRLRRDLTRPTGGERRRELGLGLDR